MSSELYAFLIILLFFVILYWMYGMMVSTIARWSKRPRKNKKTGKMIQPKLTMGETIRCYIPIYQVGYMRSWLYGSGTVFYVLGAISFGCIFLRLLNLFIPINSYVMFASVILIYIGIFLHIVLYGFATAAALKLYGFGWFTIILGAIVPHFVAFFMKTLIVNKMQAIQKEDVFSEHKSDTYIKQRTDKR